MSWGPLHDTPAGQEATGAVARNTSSSATHSPGLVLGHALTSDPGVPLTIEKDCGCRNSVDVRWWRRVPNALAPPDVAVLDTIVDGPVLDVGCGTGRHVQTLRARGVEANGIDTCPAAIQLARDAGVPCGLADVWAYRPDKPYATVLALGGSLGIAGHSGRLDDFLVLLRSFLSPGGSLVLGSVDWRTSTGSHVEHAPPISGRYPGDGKRRLHYGPMTSRWFDWARIDPDLLTTHAEHNGLRITDIVRHGKNYTATIYLPTSTPMSMCPPPRRRGIDLR